MHVHKFFAMPGVLSVLSLVLAACGSAPTTSAPFTAPAPSAPAATSAAAATGAAANVSIQLKWVAQAQFAGYYAALNQGFYKAERSSSAALYDIGRGFSTRDHLELIMNLCHVLKRPLERLVELRIALIYDSDGLPDHSCSRMA